MITAMFCAALVTVLFQKYLKLVTGSNMEILFVVAVVVSVACIAGSALIQFIMLIGLNNHCDTQIQFKGLFLLWIYEIMSIIFAVPILLYFAVVLLAIGPLLYFDLKRKRSSDIILERAQNYFGYPEGWQAFRQLMLPQ